MQKDWPHQTFAVSEYKRLRDGGSKSMCITSPTGGGKTTILLRIIEDAVSNGENVALLTQRRLLTSQLARDLTTAGVHVGVRAADFEAWTDYNAPVQICSAGTELSRVIGRRKKLVKAGYSAEFAEKNHQLFPADLLILDESHQQRGESTRGLIQEYQEKHGATIVGITATPLGIGDIYDDLIIAGNNTELRACGALVMAKCFEPAVIDVPKVRKTKTGIFSQSELDESTKAIWSQAIVGCILEHWKKHNPDGKPSIGFAPGAKESLGLAIDFWNNGINAAHISAESVFVDGKEYRTNSNDAREDIFAKSKTGEVPIIFNRFCLDDETEILTRDGWKRHDEITYSHRVANWDNGRVYYEPPLEIISRDRYPGEEMVSMESPRRSVRVTGNHKMLYRTSESGEFRKCDAIDLVNRTVKIPVCGVAEADNIALPEIKRTAGTHRRRVIAISHLARKKGMSKEDAIEYAEKSIATVDSRTYKSVSDLTLEECEFIGFWLGDGDVNEKKNGGVEYRVRESTDYPNIVNRIEHLFKSMGVDSTRKEVRGKNDGVLSEKSHYVWSFCRGTGTGKIQRSGVFYMEYMFDKSGSDYLHCLSREQFSALLSGMWMANGTNHGDKVGLPESRLCICASSKRRGLFDKLQAVASCRGYCASIREYDNGGDNRLIHLSLSSMATHTLVKGEFSFRVEPDFISEKVWCVRTSSGNIITRRKGSVTVMGNCLREGINLPWLEYLVLATPIASFQSYLQTVGRILRASPSTGKKFATIIDHANNLRMHGSPNLDHDDDWRKYFRQDETAITKDREEKKRNPESKEPEPITCPKCSRIRQSGRTCPECGFQHETSVRYVIQESGRLKAVEGDLVAKRKIKMKDDTAAKWEQCYRRCRNAKRPMSFMQVRGLFVKDNHYYPPENLPFMPKNKGDWRRKVKEVGYNDLIPKEAPVNDRVVRGPTAPRRPPAEAAPLPPVEQKKLPRTTLFD